jgi:TRAP-type C4-dicarboxylate transport system permease small subunit
MDLDVKFFNALFKIIEKLEYSVLVVGILAMAGLSCVNVASRTFWGRSFASIEEINQFLIIAVTFIGAGYAASQARHIRMSALYELLSGSGRKAVMMLIAGSTALLCFVLAYYGLHYVETVRELGTRSPALQLPYWWIYALAPLGLLTTGLQYLLTLLRNFSSPEIYESFHHIEHPGEIPVSEE